MAHQITESTTLTTRRTVGIYPTYEKAKAAAYEQFQIAHYEHDLDVTYDAADFLTEQGMVYSIDPVKEQN
jgi:hypothetical protein